MPVKQLWIFCREIGVERQTLVHIRRDVISQLGNAELCNKQPPRSLEHILVHLHATCHHVAFALYDDCRPETEANIHNPQPPKQVHSQAKCPENNKVWTSVCLTEGPKVSANSSYTS